MAWAQSTAAGDAKPERIKAFCIDFNWAPSHQLAPPGMFAHADPKVHFQWYKDLGVNVIHTFCVDIDGYAWYRGSQPAPTEPGLKHDFLKEITTLAHRDHMRVMGYFSIGSNHLWAEKHPDENYADEGIHIPLTTEYLDYLAAEIKDVLAKTDIDGFQLDAMFSAPMLPKEKKVRWMACEQKMYADLFGRPFPGKEKVDEKESAEFQRRALDHCWGRIREAAKSTKPDCIIWLSCNNLKSPQVAGSKMLRETDWLVNEHYDPAYLESVRKQVGAHTKLLQCMCGWEEDDPRQVVDDPRLADVGFYGFAAGYPQTTLPPKEGEVKTDAAIVANARNIEILRKVFHGKKLVE
jgi:hypothetical protein